MTGTFFTTNLDKLQIVRPFYKWKKYFLAKRFRVASCFAKHDCNFSR